MGTKYGWRIEKTNYSEGAVLFGLNFNTNLEWGEDERESYICIYLFKVGFAIGKFHYRA